MRTNLGQLADFDGALKVIRTGDGRWVVEAAHSIPELVRLDLVFLGGIT